MKILVTGGAGYIGSHTVRLLVEKGHYVTIYDSLVNGHREAIEEMIAEGINCQFVKGCLCNKKLLNETFKEHNFDAVIHFAGFIEAGESMFNPSKFLKNNVVNGLNLLDTMVKNDVKKIVFSSTAAVYKTKDEPLTEEDVKEPENVYGETKLMFERMLKWYNQIHGIKYVALRYFNAAGAAYNLGEDHNPETHLIPLIFHTALGKRENISIFGTDYGTEDGTCIRDYVHVMDLAKAHLLALEYSGKSKAYNVGTSKGSSVKEVINLAKEITEKNFKVIEAPKREGDSAVLVANSDKIRIELGWKPEFDIHNIIKSAWEWHSKNPEGFKK